MPDTRIGQAVTNENSRLSNTMGPITDRSKNMSLHLVRASYGKKDTPKEDREYRIEGKGPVGTIKEYKKYYPGETFEIEDRISND